MVSFYCFIIQVQVHIWLKDFFSHRLVAFMFDDINSASVPTITRMFKERNDSTSLHYSIHQWFYTITKYCIVGRFFTSTSRISVSYKRWWVWAFTFALMLSFIKSCISSYHSRKIFFFYFKYVLRLWVSSLKYSLLWTVNRKRCVSLSTTDVNLNQSYVWKV